MSTTLQRRLIPSATDRAFRAVVADAETDVRALVGALVAGDLAPAEWADQMLETLAQAHAEAAYRGRVRAGDTVPFERDDVRFGQLVAQEEQQYLWQFRQDVETGRYGSPELIPGLDQDAIQRRASLYVQRLFGTANEALLLTADEDVEWLLGATDATCADCARLAAGSPYRAGTLRVAPRDGSTRCLASCKCSVRTVSGLETFAP